MRTIYTVLGVRVGPGGQTMAELIEARNVARAEYMALRAQQRSRPCPQLDAYDQAARMLRSACTRLRVEYPD